MMNPLAGFAGLALVFGVIVQVEILLSEGESQYLFM